MSVVGQYKLDKQDISIKGVKEVIRGGSFVQGQRVEVHGSTVTNNAYIVNNDRQAFYGRVCCSSNVIGATQGNVSVGKQGEYTIFAGVLENVDYHNNSMPLVNDQTSKSAGGTSYPTPTKQVSLIRKGFVRNTQSYKNGSIDKDFLPIVGMGVYYFPNGTVGCDTATPSGSVAKFGEIVTVLEDNSYIYMITI